MGRLMATQSKGYFFSFEGGEGSGKSTQARRLYNWLESQGIPALLTREPGGTRIGEQVRELLLDRTHGELFHRAELLLYEADRAENVEEKIRPALKAGKVVICDRHADSSTVYQGFCRDLGVAEVEKLNKLATDGLKPDTVVIVDIPPDIGMERVKNRAGKLDRMESEELAFHLKVRKGFLMLARRHASRYQVFDGRKGEIELETAIREFAKSKLKRRGLWKR
jgi:dTMP kinase